MAPPISYAKATLSYPLYATDFDPYNRGYLVVGGGGGEGRSGVPNKITLLDISTRSKITTAAEIDLPRDEDNPTSLASLATKDGLITFAGINSSSKEQQAGKNEHLRSFVLDYPPRKRRRAETANDESQNVKEGEEEQKQDSVDGAAEESKARISFASKTSLFKPSSASKKETYQRLLRLSPVRKRDAASKRIGAIASSLGPENEIVIFDATTSSPSSSSVLARLTLKNGAEANDLDTAEPEEGTFKTAYCTDHEVYLHSLSYDFAHKPASSIPTSVYTLPHPDVFEGAKSRPTIRCLRWLNDTHVLALCNLPARSGAELLILRVHPDGGPGFITLRKRLPTSIKGGVSMDVCVLDSDSSGNRQVIVAIAGQDISIPVLTLNYDKASNSWGKFSTFTTLRDVHAVQMTQLRFSTHFPPSKPLTNQIPPQYVRLASISLGNTVVVDTLSLRPLEPRKRDTRYVLSTPGSENLLSFASYALIAFSILLCALLAQQVLLWTDKASDEGARGPISQGRWIFGDRTEDVVIPSSGPLSSAAHTVETAIPDAIPGKHHLRELLSRHASLSRSQKSIIVRENSPDASSSDLSVTADMHHNGAEEDEVDEAVVKARTTAKRWEDLEHHEREKWKERLIRAGEWSLDEGEAVLKGVFFSTWANLVGAAARAV